MTIEQEPLQKPEKLVQLFAPLFHLKAIAESLKMMLFATDTLMKEYEMNSLHGNDKNISN